MMKPGIYIKSKLVSFLASRTRTDIARFRARLSRKGLPAVHYFHQVDDPYSHMAVQKLPMLVERYDVNFVPHLVSAPAPAYQGDAARFKQWALRDARSVAADYGVLLPDIVDDIDPDQSRLATCLIDRAVTISEFAALAAETGRQLWQGEHLAGETPSIDLTLAGNQLRESLGHYLSATFYFEGEWYWGVDRLHHLERRLSDEGFSNNPGQLCVPRPVPEPVTGDASGLTLEYFPSLRSPYTAISFDRTIDMVRRTGVSLRLRPVMPMMMRGVPAPRYKQFYIMSDARREADYYGVPFGRIVDPFGEPVKRAFSLLPFMQSRGSDIEYCSQYLKASWADGIDITTDEGLRHVVIQSGETWPDALEHLGTADWQQVLECNVQDMLAAGLWGVPSFRVTGGDLPPFQCWGQDRLWRVESEIARRCS